MTTCEKDHISVCICTFKRPHYLAKLLSELQNQIVSESFLYSIVVVDNDKAQSGRTVTCSFAEGSKRKIDYACVPEQNISLARNKAIEMAKGNLIALIDDDEFPDRRWLYNLHKTYMEFNADGVLGPVKPYFEDDPPLWLIKSKLCERSSFPTGTTLRNTRDTRTGNVLLNSKILNQPGHVFNPSFGRTGGEDADFFKRMMNNGHTFVWSNDAIVNEAVPKERLRRKYFIKRALLRGNLNSRHKPFFSLDSLKSVIAASLYTTALPLLLILGQHLFMRYLIKDCDHIGKILGRLGIKVVKERSF